MHTRHIMLIDHRAETRQNTLFLLRLARHRITAVNDLAEAVNWLGNRRSLQEPLDLALLNNPLADPLPSALLGALRELAPELPLLWVQRGTEVPPPTTGRVLCCRPESILEAIQIL